MPNYLMEHWVSITDFHIDLVPGAIAKHARLYPAHMIHLHDFKKELLHLVEMTVLSLQGASEWVSPTFINPPKNLAKFFGLVIYGNY
jgi:hypothetical protein